MIVLHILGILLKILGIILLALLAVILVFFLILLFVPVRYQAELWRDGKELKVKAQVSYLLRAVRASVFFEDKKLDFSVKLLWFTLFLQSGERKKKPKKGAEADKPKERDTQSENNNNPVTNESEEKNIEDLGDNSESEKEGDPAEKKVTQNPESDYNPAEKDCKSEENNTEDMKNSSESEKEGDLEEDEYQDRQESESVETEHNKFSWFFQLRRKLYGLKEKLLIKIEKIKEFFSHIRDVLHSLLEKVKSADDSLGLIRVFFEDEINKKGLRCSGKAILQLLKYVLPYKIKGELVFATGDAYSLGRALSVLSIIYPLYAKNLNIHADFEADSFRLDGHILLKGRIRFVRILFIAVRLWFAGKLKLVLKNVKELKNSLMSAQNGQ